MVKGFRGKWSIYWRPDMWQLLVIQRPAPSLLQHSVGAAYPGVTRDILPGRELARQPGQHPRVARLGWDIESLLWIRLAVIQLILRPGDCPQVRQLDGGLALPVIILLKCDSPGKRCFGPRSVENVLKCGGEVSVLVNGKWRPVVDVVDQGVPGNIKTWC